MKRTLAPLPLLALLLTACTGMDDHEVCRAFIEASSEEAYRDLTNKAADGRLDSRIKEYVREIDEQNESGGSYLRASTREVRDYCELEYGVTR